ncbi:22024_t:CDS:2, partial [Gigaspora rosea]
MSNLGLGESKSTDRLMTEEIRHILNHKVLDLNTPLGLLKRFFSGFLYWYLDKALDDRIIHSLFKTICIECELNVESRNISNHSGRRTSIMELFNIGVPENTGCAISGHKSSGRYYAYTKPTDKHKREALANILNKIINTELSNETAQDLIINTAIFNKTAQDSVEHINSEFNNNEELQSIRSEDDELSDVDLNNSVQMEQKEHKFYEKFHTAREIFNNSHKRALNITDENEQLHNHKKNEL